MTYKFRLCFRLLGDTTFTGEDESIEFQTRTGETLTLAAVDKERKLNSSNRFSLIGGPYKSVKEANEAGNAARTALLYYAASNRVGIDLGRCAPAGGLTKAGKELFSKKLGAPVLDDYLGLTIFEAELHPLFVQFHAKAVVGKATQTFVGTVGDAFRRYSFSSSRAELATELFTMSHFEGTPSARFLSLFMSLETLMEPAPRSDAAREHVRTLIEATKDAELPQPDKKLLLGALGRLQNESILQTGKKIAQALLADNLYDSLPPDKFFSKVYTLRNNLVHRGIVDRDELSRILGEMDRFVSDILCRQFVDI